MSDFISSTRKEKRRFRNRNLNKEEVIEYMVRAMDYQPRDHIGNYMLFLSSVLGLFFTPKEVDEELF